MYCNRKRLWGWEGGEGFYFYFYFSVIFIFPSFLFFVLCLNLTLVLAFSRSCLMAGSRRDNDRVRESRAQGMKSALKLNREEC